MKPVDRERVEKIDDFIREELPRLEKNDDFPLISVRNESGAKVINFRDRRILEELSIRQISDELSDIVQENPGVVVVLDFSNVDHISSAANGMLISLNKLIGEIGGQLRLSSISPQIYENFRITRLNKLFKIYPTSKDAILDKDRLQH